MVVRAFAQIVITASIQGLEMIIFSIETITCELIFVYYSGIIVIYIYMNLSDHNYLIQCKTYLSDRQNNNIRYFSSGACARGRNYKKSSYK